MISSLFRLFKERPSTTPTPAPDGERGQPKPKPRTDCGTGTAAGIANPASKGNPPRAQAQTNPNPNAFKPREQPELNEYCNNGTQNIKGLSNLTGQIKGNGNGAINFGKMTASSAADRGTNTPPPTQPDPNFQQNLAALGMLVDTVNSLDGGKSDFATPQSSSSGPPGSGKVIKGKDFNYTGTQNITGLSNLTGYTEGNANGTINFGELCC